ncbi:MAG: MFS transporter [Culicoidibacterales bacterium]
MEIKKVQKTVWSVRFFYLFYLVGVGLFYNLMPLYLQENLGFDATSIGIIMSVGSIMSIGVATLWGIAADVTKNPRLILLILLGMSAGSALLLGSTTTFAAVLAVMVVLEFFRSGIFPLIDATATTIAFQTKIPFGKMRWFGSFGYAVSVLAFTPFIEKIGLDSIFIIFMLFLSLPIFFLRNLPRPAQKEQSHFIKDFRYLLTNKIYWFILLIGALNFGTMNAASNYLAMHVQTLGGGVLAVGVCTLIAAGISEVPALIYVEKIYNRIGLKETMLIGLVLSLCRWIIAFFAPNIFVFFLTLFGHGIAFAFVQPALFTLIRQNVSENITGTAIALNVAVSGIVLTALNIITGNFIDRSGTTTVMFVIFACVSFLALILMLIFRKLQGKEQNHANLG